MAKLTELQEELLQEEMDALRALAKRHTRWANAMSDFDDIMPHRQIATHIKGVVDEINHLFFGVHEASNRKTDD